MIPIKFSDIKIDIQNALQEKLKLAPIQNEAGFALIEGFMMLPLQGEISNTVMLGGPSIPIPRNTQQFKRSDWIKYLRSK